jgi:hypothetical protein
MRFLLVRWTNVPELRVAIGICMFASNRVSMMRSGIVGGDHQANDLAALRPIGP